MDIVLEICDYFVFDQFYAWAFPKGPELAAGLVGADIANSWAHYNASSSSMRSPNLPKPLQTTLNTVLGQISKYQDASEVYGNDGRFLPLNSFTNETSILRANLVRQAASMLFITILFGLVLYFSVAGISYLTVFDKKIFNHPRYLKNQMSLEIHQATTAIPVMVALTLPFFMLEIHGFSKLYMNIDELTGGWKAIFWQIITFILFTDCGIYFIHRGLHYPAVYKRLHKPHHKWIVCTPFASHAFHPVDGWAQSLPYHIYPMVFPLHKVLYLLLFTFVNFWTVMIHDGQYLSNDPVVNGTACHTVHHLYFNYNYGQFTTLWDRLGRSYRRPDDKFFVKNKEEEEKVMWKEQVKKMEIIRNELEGKEDDRVYVD